MTRASSALRGSDAAVSLRDEARGREDAGGGLGVDGGNANADWNGGNSVA